MLKRPIYATLLPDFLYIIEHRKSFTSFLPLWPWVRSKSRSRSFNWYWAVDSMENFKHTKFDEDLLMNTNTQTNISDCCWCRYSCCMLNGLFIRSVTFFLRLFFFFFFFSFFNTKSQKWGYLLWTNTRHTNRLWAYNSNNTCFINMTNHLWMKLKTFRHTEHRSAGFLIPVWSYGGKGHPNWHKTVPFGAACHHIKFETIRLIVSVCMPALRYVLWHRLCKVLFSKKNSSETNFKRTNMS